MRRDLILSATAAGAAFGLNKRLAFNGIWEKPHDPGFIKNASVDDVKNALAGSSLPTEFVSIPFTVLVVNTGSKLVMCDAATGGQVQRSCLAR